MMWHYHFLTHTLICAILINGITSSGPTCNLEDTISLIQTSLTEVDVAETDKVILLLGDTKSGVSTVAQILAGDNSKLKTVDNDGYITVIKDENDLIGQEVVSHTIFPVKIETDDGIFIDLPGINTERRGNDLGQACTNIVTSFFINRILRQSRLVKLGLVVDSHLLRSDTSIVKLVQYLLNIRQIIKNTETYQMSTFMVVNRGQTDEINFLEAVSEYVDKTSDLTIEEKEFIDNITDIINRNYKVLPSPTTIGITINDDTVMQTAKINTLEMINSLEFAQKQSTTTGYSLSDTSTQLIISLIDSTKRNLVRLTSPLPKLVAEHYVQVTQDIIDMQQFLNETKLDLKSFEDLLTRSKQIYRIDDFIVMLKTTFLDVHIDLPYQQISQLNQLSMQVQFIENITETQIEFDSRIWTDTVEKMVAVVRQTYTWHEFILSLYQVFSGYQVQTNRQLYNVTDFKDWDEPESDLGLVITSSNFKEFLNVVIPYFFDSDSDYYSLLNIEADDYKIDMLNSIIERTLNSDVEVLTDDSTVYFIRDSITFCEVADMLSEYSELNVSIIGINSVIVDCNLTFVDGQHVSVMGWNWISNGSYTIRLEGVDGDSNFTANPTLDGAPGVPGGNSGNFYSIGKHAENLYLTVETVGGVGGAGQNGSTGTSGTADSNNAFATDPSCSFSLGNSSLGTNIYLDPVTCGKNGGKGGAGGVGGNGGAVGTVWLQSETYPVYKNIQKGASGEEGRGGKGGYGGAADKFVMEECNEGDCSFVNSGLYPMTLYPGGEFGIDGGNSAGIILPGRDELGIFVKAINYYKDYLSLHINDSLIRSDVIETLEIIDEPNNVNIYSILDYFDEYKKLNSKYTTISDKEEALFHFRIFDKKLTDNLENLVQNKTDNKKALAQLAASLKTRISTITLDTGGLVIDMDGYLNLTLSTISELKKYIDEKKDEQIRQHQQQYMDQYRSDIRKKEDEAFDLIHNILYPQIDKVFAEINKTVDNLINDVNSLREKGQEVEEELQDKKAELKRKLGLQVFLGVFFYGIKMAITVSETPLNDTLLSITDKVEGSIDINSSDLPTFPLPPGVVEGQQQVLDEWLKRRNLTAEFLTEVCEDLEEELGNNNEVVISMNDVIDALYEGRYNDKSVQDVLKIVTDVIEKNLAEESTTKKDQEVYEKAWADVTISGFPDLVNTLKSRGSSKTGNTRRVTKQDLKTCEEEITETRAKVLLLSLYLSEIEYYLIPMISQMQENIEYVENNLENKTSAVLDVGKWGVVSALKEFSRSMTKFTDGFNEEDEFAVEIDKLNDILITIFGVYDQIQEWQEQEQLGSYIYNVVCPEYDEIEIEDEELRTAVDDMRMDMRVSMVLLHYNTAVRAFKQWVFPFAEPYMYDLNLNVTGDTPEVVVENVQRVINSMKLKLSEYYSRVDDYDKYITEGSFSSDSVTSKPFVVFDNSEYKDDISNLLLGNEIALSSIKGMFDYNTKNALKFNKLQLKLKLKEKNETLSAEFEEIVKYFDVYLRHTGNNYYSYNNVTYYLTNDNLDFSYSLEEDQYGDPIRYNNVFSKILKGDLMLSPFALWRVKLYKDENYKLKRDAPDFGDLWKYKDLVNMEFVGRGKYITPINGELPMLNMDKYYVHV